jgi:hypothetical protein
MFNDKTVRNLSHPGFSFVLALVAGIFAGIGSWVSLPVLFVGCLFMAHSAISNRKEATDE